MASGRIDEMDTFCRKLPKIELHAHLNGSLSRSTLNRLGCLEDSISEYQNVDTSLEHVFDLFKVAHKATSNIENLYVATKSVIEEFAEDNVVYLELRTTPRCEEVMSEGDYIETVIRAIHECDPSKIIVKLLLSLDRRKSHLEQASTLDLIIKYKKKYPELIKGVDLSGDPAKGQFFRDLFEKARQNGLHTAIHCAELKNDDELRDIIDYKPDRIGHGTCLHPNYGGCEQIWATYKRLRIPVECCLTSNVICLTAKSYADHHIQEWAKEGLPFCLATDDKGVFKTTLSKEFFHFSEAFKITNKLDLWHISKSSVGYSFASAKEKEFLRLVLEHWKNTNIPD